jgi:hypothetical protein
MGPSGRFAASFPYQEIPPEIIAHGSSHPVWAARARSRGYSQQKRIALVPVHDLDRRDARR